MLEASVTYIADRGYVSFKLFQQIVEQQAFFIIRIKSSIKETVVHRLEVIVPEEWSSFFVKVSDSMIYFSNDPDKISYHLITFVFENEAYRIATNRTDLTTGEIIMLYAYRWQIELFFRSIKRTFHALHLGSHHEKGIEIQFYIYLIVYLLLLYFNKALLKNKWKRIPSRMNLAVKSQNLHRQKIIQHAFLTRSLVTLLGGRLNFFGK